MWKFRSYSSLWLQYAYCFKIDGPQKSKLKKSICIAAQIFEKQICESHQFWTICISFFKLEYDRNFQIHWNFEQRSHIAQEFENVRARKGYALLHWSFWQEFTFFQVSANFLKIGGVKFSTFWTPFKLRWNEKKLFVFEAEGIWCWKKNSIFYVCNMPFNWNSFYLMWLQKIHEWCWIVVTNSSNAKWRSICNFDNFTCEWNVFFPKNTLYRVNASVEMYQISKECISANFKNKYMGESASKSCCECLIFNKI